MNHDSFNAWGRCNIVLGTSYVELCVGRLIRLCLYTRMYVCLHVG